MHRLENTETLEGNKLNLSSNSPDQYNERYSTAAISFTQRLQ